MDDANRGRPMTETRTGDRHRLTITRKEYGKVESGDVQVQVASWFPWKTETINLSNEEAYRIAAMLRDARQKMEDMEEGDLENNPVFLTLNLLVLSFVEEYKKEYQK